MGNTNIQIETKKEKDYFLFIKTFALTILFTKFETFKKDNYVNLQNRTSP